MTRLFAFVLAFALAACGAPETDPSASEAPVADTSVADAPPASAPVAMEDGVQVAHVEAGMSGYAPGRVELEAGVPARLVFTRTVESDCMEHVQIPALGVERTRLPLNEPVAVEFTPEEGGDYTFVCGMDMVSGTLVVKG